MTKSESIKEIASALCDAQKAIKNASKDASNPFFKSHYADLASVREAIQVPFAANGLSVSQLLGNDAHGVVVETVLMHKSGEFIASAFSVKPVKDDPQGAGSAITYARRYALQAIAGIASEDDDAEGAMGRTHDKPKSDGKDNKTPAAKPAASTPPAAPTPKEKQHDAVAALKTGETCTISQPVEKVWQPKDRNTKRVKFVGDPTHYVTFHNLSEVKAGDTITAQIVCKETNDATVYYLIEEYQPF